MRLVRMVRIAVTSLLRHKLRTALATAGLVVGVAVTLVMVGVGEGAKHEILAQIRRLGSNMLVVAPAESEPVPGRRRQARRAISLTLEDGVAIAQCASVVRTAPSRSGTKRIKFAQLSTMATVLGTTPAYRHIKNAEVASGRYFGEQEVEAGARVAVIGRTVAQNLFGSADPLGAQVRIGHVPFEIIGVLVAKGASADGNGDQDNQMVIPIKTAMRRVFNVNHLDSIYVETSGPEVGSRAEQEIAALLRGRHDLQRLRKKDDFIIEDQARALRAEVDAADSFTSMIAGVAGVSLFVGAMGILSIMLITIRERVGEIGLRIAVGARPRDILTQFLFESVALGVCGGVFGVALGVVTTVGIGEYTEWATHVSPEWAVASLAASLVLGIGVGVYPAMRAAALDPIVALRAQ